MPVSKKRKKKQTNVPKRVNPIFKGHLCPSREVMLDRIVETNVRRRVHSASKLHMYKALTERKLQEVYYNTCVYGGESC